MLNDAPPAWRTTRILRFPAHLSLGDVYLLDVTRTPAGDPYAYWDPARFEKLGPAEGQFQVPAGSLACLKLRPGKARALARLAEHGIEGLDALHASFTELGDEELASLGGLQNLYALYLKATRVTAAGLAHLRPHDALRTLYLGKLRPGREGLEHVAALPALVELDLGGTRVAAPRPGLDLRRHDDGRRGRVPRQTLQAGGGLPLSSGPGGGIVRALRPS